LAHDIDTPNIVYFFVYNYVSRLVHIAQFNEFTAWQRKPFMSSDLTTILQTPSLCHTLEIWA